MCVLTDSLAIDVQETCNRALSLQHELDVVRGKYDRLLAAAKEIEETAGATHGVECCEFWYAFEMLQSAIREAEEATS